MKHPNDDELLAYARDCFHSRTRSTSGTRDVQEHLMVCSLCREHYAQIEFAYTESVLRACIQLDASRSYPSITASVMQRVQNPKSIQITPDRRNVKTASGISQYRGRQHEPTASLLSWRFASIPIGLILVFVFLALVTVIALAWNWLHPNVYPLGPTNKTGGAGYIQVPTLPRQLSEPYLVICNQPGDVDQKYMRICGHDYTPGATVELVISMPGTAHQVHKTLTVAANGTIQYVLYIASCKAVPSTIIAFSENHIAKLPSAQQDIRFGTCSPVSGVVGTPEQGAS